MTSLEYQGRPNAATVEVEAAALAAATPGQPLRYWARSAVPEAIDYGEDELVGRVLSETMSSAAVMINDSQGLTRTTGSQIAAAAMFTTAGMASLAVVICAVAVIALGVGYYMPRNNNAGGTSEPMLPVMDPAVPRPGPSAAPTPQRPLAKPSPAAVPKSAPKPQATPTPKAATFEMTFSSLPMGAEVFLDETSLGLTPVMNVEVPEGTRKLRMVLDGNASERTITVGRRGAKKYIWNGGDEWQVSY